MTKLPPRTKNRGGGFYDRSDIKIAEGLSA